MGELLAETFHRVISAKRLTMNPDQLDLFNLPPEPSPLPAADAPTDPSWGPPPKLRGHQLHLPGDSLQVGDRLASPYGEAVLIQLVQGASFCWVRVSGRLRVVWLKDCAKVGPFLENR